MSFTKQYKKFFIFGALPLFIFTVVLLVPFAQGLALTFTNWDGFEVSSFVGLDNYIKSFQDPGFWTTLSFTTSFVLVSIVLINVVAFGLALLVTAKLRSSNIFRTFFFVPNLIGGVVLGVIWQFIFSGAIVELGKSFDIPFLQTQCSMTQHLLFGPS